MLTESEFRKVLTQYVKGFRRDKEAAEALGIQPSALSDILRGRKRPYKYLAEKLGYRYVPMYENTKKMEKDIHTH